MDAAYLMDGAFWMAIWLSGGSGTPRLWTRWVRASTVARRPLAVTTNSHRLSGDQASVDPKGNARPDGTATVCSAPEPRLTRRKASRRPAGCTTAAVEPSGAMTPGSEPGTSAFPGRVCRAPLAGSITTFAQCWLPRQPATSHRVGPTAVSSPAILRMWPGRTSYRPVSSGPESSAYPWPSGLTSHGPRDGRRRPGPAAWPSSRTSGIVLDPLGGWTHTVPWPGPGITVPPWLSPPDRVWA